jgi:hippurate hydrolase
MRENFMSNWRRLHCAPQKGEFIRYASGDLHGSLTVTGKGSHGARPEEGIDPVLTACHVTTALQAIVSRNVRPADTAVLSVTTIQAGDAYNVIPQTAVIRGTFRTFSNDTMKQIEDCIRRTATGVAAAFGATAEVEFPDVFAPLINNPAETEFIADAAAEIVGEANVNRNRSLITAAEDFAYMVEACPGAFINIGIAGTVGSCPVHNPHYDFNDAALPIGASLFARLKICRDCGLLCIERTRQPRRLHRAATETLSV